MTVTARHCDVPDELRERAVEMVTRVAKVVRRTLRAQVVFDADHQRNVVEIQLHLPRGGTVVARAEADDFRTALDRAVARLRAQLEKISTRRQRRQSAS